MDAFYASIEQRDDPNLRGRPVAVGGSENRGVVAAASYEARKFGVRSAMPGKIAASRCPDLVFIRPDFSKYHKISKTIREIFFEYTDLVEPLSLDEAYLDVTHNKKGIPSATLIANEIRQRIYETTQLTASAGVSYNKFLAKTASDVNKPNGLFLIKPGQGESYVEQLPVERFFGIGKVTAEKMHKLGIFTGKDLKAYSIDALSRLFGKAGSYFYDISRAVDHRKVKPDRERKSVGVERTFDKDIISDLELKEKLDLIAAKLIDDMKRLQIKAKTLTLKLRYGDFTTITRSKTKSSALHISEIEALGEEMLLQVPIDQRGVRLLGLSVSNFVDEKDGIQLTIEF